MHDIKQGDIIKMTRKLENFLEMMTVERLISTNTLISYKNDINDLLHFLAANDIRLEGVTYNQLVLYLSHLHEMSFAASTIARKISAIRTFFSFLFLDGVILYNPSINLSLPKKPHLLPKALSRTNITKLIEAAQYNKSYDGLRNLAMLEILYSTGLRVSELVTLHLDNVIYALNSSEHTMIVYGKGNRERVVVLNKDSIDALVTYLKIRGKIIPNVDLAKIPWLFPSLNKRGKVTHLSRQRFGQILKELAVNNGVPINIVSPHKVRHSFASHMLRNGADIRVIQELLGHVSISSTQIYTKVENQHMAGELEEKHPLGDITNMVVENISATNLANTQAEMDSKNPSTKKINKSIKD